MEKREIKYYHSMTSEIEMVYCKNSHISYPEHNHISVYTIVLVIDGCIELKKKDGTIIHHINDLIIIPPYEPHTIISGKEGYTTLTVCMKKELFSDFDKNSQLSIFTELADYFISKGILYKEQVRMLSDTIVTLYEGITNQKYKSNATFASTKKLLETSPERELKLDELSRVSYLSKYHFTRQFKKVVGLTPHQFQLQNRIRKAQHLLQQKYPIIEVALATGFYDQSHFIKTFKRVVGITPSEYLQAYIFLPNRD